jgi:hypothetical protein
MKNALSIDLWANSPGSAEINRRVVLVVDSCSNEELEKVIRDLRVTDPNHRTYQSITQFVVGPFDELLTVMLPSAGLIERAVTDYIQVQHAKLDAKKFRESGGNR